MRVLIGCECSGMVRRAFRALGHDAWSCDMLESEDKSPHHYVCDVREVLHDKWDLGIFHPPCTYLSVSGLHWNYRGRGWDKTFEALDFVRLLMSVPYPHCIENPVSIISSHIRPPDQTIQPYEFGDDASKRTCLWLSGVPPLVPTQRVPGRTAFHNGKFVERWSNQTDSGQNKLPPSTRRTRLRSVTYPGVASAMANQWSAYLTAKAA